MIYAILIVNNHGKPRLSKFFDYHVRGGPQPNFVNYFMNHQKDFDFDLIDYDHNTCLWLTCCVCVCVCNGFPCAISGAERG
jgi:hypothetical protein